MSGPATVPDSLIGLEFGHYRILERIGSGGMGVVYRGYDAHLDREVAIKVLNPGTIADDHSRKARYAEKQPPVRKRRPSR